MVQKIALLLLLAIPATVFGQHSLKAKTNIEKVTVFLNGAQITRTGKASLTNGDNEVRFEGLSQYIENNSIQIKANSQSVTIVSVKHEMNFLDKKKDEPRIAEIKDSIEDLQFKVEIRNSHKVVYLEEKSMLISNKSIGGEDSGVDIEDLMDVSDFYRSRLLEIETKLLDIDRSVRKMKTSIHRLSNQLKEINNQKGEYSSDIIVKVSSKGKQSPKFELSYITKGAGWIPKYDIRSNDINGPVALTYKGDVFQNTGNDWNNIQIALSTGNPVINNTQPGYYPWYLKYYSEYKNRGGGGRRKGVSYAYASAYNNRSSNDNDGIADLEEVKMENEKSISNSLSDFTTVTESQVNSEFEISMPYTIKSDGKPNVVEIQDYELPVSYQYMSYPKKDKDAFLLARVSGWGNYNLLPGYVNTFYERTYVGESYLNTNITEDTLNVSLGRDKSIVINREKINDFCKNSSFGGNKKSTRGYQIKIRNNKSQAIEIEVVDQIPLSNNKDIVVELLEDGGAKHDETTGKLSWKLNIPAGETVDISFKFQVKYPKNKNLSNL